MKSLEVEGRVLRGYAAFFNRWSKMGAISGGDFYEMFQPGAFAHSLWSYEHLGRDITCVVNHDDNLILGSFSRGDLKLYENERGLRFELRLPNSKLGNDVLLRVINNPVEMSIKFGVISHFFFRENGLRYRVIRDADLHHISTVPSAAYRTYVLPMDSKGAKREAGRISRMRRSLRRRHLELLEKRI